MTLDLGPTVAARGVARTTTGSVQIDQMKYQGTAASFQTSNIASATEILDLTLETTTGSVEVDYRTSTSGAAPTDYLRGKGPPYLAI